MTPQLTPKQNEDYQNALKIGTILAGVAGIRGSLRIRVNSNTLNEAVRLYSTLGAKIPHLQEAQQFVTNCLLHSAETFAICSNRIVLCHYLIGQDVAYWYGNGKMKEQEPLDNVIFFSGDNSSMIASILLEQPVFQRLQPFLSAQPKAVA